MYPFKLEPVPPGLVAKLTQQQLALRKQVKIQALKKQPQLVAACDSSLKDDQIFSVFVLFKFPGLEILEVQQSWSKLELPYIPGFLAFRECPNLLKAYALLTQDPDLIFVDGHGIAHPRGLGIASQLGVSLNKPTIGIAKKVLFGKYEEPGSEIGDYTEIIGKGEKVGLALRTKLKVKPVFISPGHLVDFDDSLKLTLQTLGKYRLPEPTRIADKYTKELKES